MKSISEHVHHSIDWLASSSDLNPIENVWALLKGAVDKRNHSNADELRRYILEEWENLNNNVVSGLVRSGLENLISFQFFQFFCGKKLRPSLEVIS